MIVFSLLHPPRGSHHISSHASLNHSHHSCHKSHLIQCQAGPDIWITTRTRFPIFAFCFDIHDISRSTNGSMRNFLTSQHQALLRCYACRNDDQREIHSPCYRYPSHTTSPTLHSGFIDHSSYVLAARRRNRLTRVKSLSGSTITVEYARIDEGCFWGFVYAYAYAHANVCIISGHSFMLVMEAAPAVIGLNRAIGLRGSQMRSHWNNRLRLCRAWIWLGWIEVCGGDKPIDQCIGN